MKRHHNTPDSHQNLDRWLLTYADMITLLTAFFLMLYSMSVMSRGKFSALATSVRSGFGSVTPGGTGILKDGSVGRASGNLSGAEYRKYQDAMADLQRFVEQQGKSKIVRVRSDARGVTISLLSDGLLFERGSAALKTESGALLDHVAQLLRTMPNDIQVEGHTCDLPIHTVAFPSNWELSTARAGAILRYFTTDTNALPSQRFTCAGYADTRPLADNDTEEHRAQNRRVDIVLLKTDAQRDAEALRRQEIRRIQER